MLTKGDIADVIAERLGLQPAAGPARLSSPAVPAASRPLPKKVFVSDWELRRVFKEGQKTIRLPANAIVSPLSEDWLDYQGVKIIRE
jgi:hypothetical protein